MLTSAQMTAIVQGGGSVLLQGRVISQVADVPSQATLDALATSFQTANSNLATARTNLASDLAAEKSAMDQIQALNLARS